MKTDKAGIKLVSGFYWIRHRGYITVAEYDEKSDRWWMIGDEYHSHCIDEVIAIIPQPLTIPTKHQDHDPRPS